MGFTKQTLGVIPVRHTYTIQDKKIVTEWKFARLPQSEVDAEEQKRILELSDEEAGPRVLLQHLKARLIETPTGFDDWPLEGNLKEQIELYFGGADKESANAREIAAAAWSVARDGIWPEEFFRGV